MEELVTERHVQALWYDAALRPPELRTRGGERVRVIDPGAWNLEAGPDFRRAVLAFGEKGERRTGDVEVHLRPADWAAHRHARDPAYRGVIAHVTWSSGPLPTGADALPPNCASICLGDFVLTRRDFSPYEIDLGAYPYAKLPAGPRPCEERFRGRTDEALAVLRAAGVCRLEMKARRFQTLLLRIGCREQVFYEEVFAALGFKYNAFPFRDVAATMRWADLPRDPDLAYVCLRNVAELKAGSAAPWRCANVRPANSPDHRLQTAAGLFAEGPGLIEAFDACRLAAPEGAKAALGLLRRHGIGPGRAAAILANVLVPLALAEGRLERVPARLPPEDLSAPVRLTAFRLLGRDHNPALYSGDGVLIQGLLHVHRTFCLAVHPDCRSCRFGRRPDGAR